MMSECGALTLNFLDYRMQSDFHFGGFSVRMTHGTSFSVADDLLALFEAQCAARERSAQLGALQVLIRDERFALGGSLPAGSSSSQRLKAELLSESTPCYVLVRLGGEDGVGKAVWALVSFVPDTAPAREKMPYSSGREGLRP